MGILLCGCCFSNLSAKTNEIILIIADFIALFLLVSCFVLIEWKEISFLNLILFIIMLLIITICFVFAILLRVWRSSGVIKTDKRGKAMNIATASMVLKIICLLACIIEEIILMVSFSKVLADCIDDNDTFDIYYRRQLSKKSTICQEKKINVDREYYISYLNFSYMEFMLILSTCILSILKKRIINKLDDDLPVAIGSMGQFGRQVIVVHPGQVVGMPNNYNYYPQNMNFAPQNNYPYSNSSRYINAQPIHVGSQNKINNNNSNYIIKNNSDAASSNY